MDLSDARPGLDVIYYSRQFNATKGRNHGPARKLPARIVRVGKQRVTIQLKDDQTFRIVEPENLKVQE